MLPNAKALTVNLMFQLIEFEDQDQLVRVTRGRRERLKKKRINKCLKLQKGVLFNKCSHYML